MQTYACDFLFPEWSMWEQFVIDDQAGALRLDALLSSHPIEVPIAHAEEVEQVFDAISYFKGACVVRLAYSYLGKEAFFLGLQLYMDRHKYSNTETEDLWAAWEEVSGKPVLTVMNSWTKQMGFPVLTLTSATWSEDCTSCTVSLEQEWFISDGSTPPDKNKLWSIPLEVSLGGMHEPLQLGILDTRSTTIVIPVESGKKTWIKFNGGQYIPMRVNYLVEEVRQELRQAVLSGEMQVTDRSGLLSDTFALVKAGKVDPGDLITLLSAYRNETSMPVMSAVEDSLTALHKILLNKPELLKEFKEFGRKVIAAPVATVGWDVKPDEGHLTNLMRASLIRLQALFDSDNPVTVAAAKERFEAYVNDYKNGEKHLPSDIKTAVIQLVLGMQTTESETKKNYDKCLELIDLVDSTQEKKEIMLAIGSVASMDLKKKTLDWCTSGAVKKQDFFYPIGSVGSSSLQGQELTWNYLKSNFSRIVEMIRSASPSILGAVVSYSCAEFASEERAKEIEEFFIANQHEHPVPLISRKLMQIVENTRANASFLTALEGSEAFKVNLKASFN